jgi:hypothetical protein
MTIAKQLSNLLLVCTFLLCAPALAQDAGKADLRLRLKKGDVHKLRVTVEQHVEQKAAAGKQAIDQTMGVDYSLSVDDVDPDGAMAVTMKYDAVRFRYKGPSGAAEYDSAMPPKDVPAVARGFAAMQGLAVKMRVAPTGQVTAVERVEELMDEILRKLNLPEGPQKAAARKVLGEQFGEAAMKQNLQTMFAVYPDGPVAIGDSWQRKVSTSKGMPAVLEATYTLKDRKSGVCTIEVHAKVAPNPDAPPVEMGTGKMAYELSGEQRGTMEVDEASGLPRKMTTTQDVSGTMTYKTTAYGNSPGGRRSDGGETTSEISVKEKVTLEPL